MTVGGIDGDVVKDWYLEDSMGNKTFNLADRAKGKNIDLLVNARCRTVTHFISRISTNLLIAQQSQINAMRK